MSQVHAQFTAFDGKQEIGSCVLIISRFYLQNKYPHHSNQEEEYDICHMMKANFPRLTSYKLDGPY